MRIALFGGSGQLGTELKGRAKALDFELFSPVRNEVDVVEAEQVRGVLESLQPDVVVNAAAYTAVDKAEEERDLVFAINSDGARNIADGCRVVGARLIHISTDYVFDGSLGRPLSEKDSVNPLSVYGASKLAGEQGVLESLSGQSVILRTQALYGRGGPNFVATMLSLFKERELIKVVNDQFVSPTWAGWLAEVVLDLMRIDCAGVLHASCGGTVSWFDFAKTIQAKSRDILGLDSQTVIEPIGSNDFQRPAKRPEFSAFDTGLLEATLKRPVASWEASLDYFLEELRQQKEASRV